ncbi:MULTISPECIES: MFS transporter [Pseudoalteromonas]|uniref:MFS transporter n=1 Tax=Pseudoalteromonas obscura TaxID=3048491 RepID=A0ABT7EMG6_9GAMM|nr:MULTISPECIES: MFS transporter [Pseudoalteromonas]MBQ4837810.1 MFS transporter [Pseudoalteromonas luteoviolacea]MDK2596245.1 MFS transporter [Pseudoalteromonas sp. P94(2023)]
MKNITPQPPRQHSIWIYIVFAFIAMSGLSYINFLPGLVNALAGNIGYSESEAGQIVSLNGYGALFGTATAIFVVRRFPWKPLLLASFVPLLLLEVSTPSIDGLNAMLITRFFSGFTGGLAVGVSFSMLARLTNSDRAFGILLFTQFTIGALVMYCLPLLESNNNHFAVFYIMAAIVMAGLLLTLFMSPHTLPKAAISHMQANIKSIAHSVRLMLTILLYISAASALYTYVGVIGIHANFGQEQVSTDIAFTGLLGLIGAMLPMLKSRLLKRQPLIVSGALLCAAASIMLLQPALSHAIYIVALALVFFTWPAVQSYLFASAADLDPSGRLSTIASLIASVGMASGPLLAALLIEPGNYTSMLYTCSALFALSTVVLLIPLKSHSNINSLQPNRSHSEIS